MSSTRGKVSGKDACSHHCCSTCYLTAVLRVAEKHFIADGAIMDNKVQLKLINYDKKKGAPPTGKVDGGRGRRRRRSIYCGVC